MDMIAEALTGRRTNILGPPAEMDGEGIAGDVLDKDEGTEDDEKGEVENEEGIDDENEGMEGEDRVGIAEEEEAEGACAEESGVGMALPLS